MRTTTITSVAALLSGILLPNFGAQATNFTGTAYYTDYGNGTVHSVTYSYDNVAKVFGVGVPNLVASLPGADGIVFAPNGNILVGGQGAAVYNVTPSSGSFNSASAANASFHLTLAPDGKSVYTSPFGGPLANIPLTNFGTANAPTVTAISGSEGGVTQLAFANGTTFYVNGNPNCCGNVGTIDLATGVTTRLAGGTAVGAAHGIILDPYSGLIDLFGGGLVATLNPITLAISASVHLPNSPGDFDQGAPDGLGHALIAGSGGLTFVDYEGTSILTPNFVAFIGGFGNIDDIAPLAGSGSQIGDTPIPGALPLFATGLTGFGLLVWRKKRKPTATAS
jgi:hypothetical protein